MVYDDDTGRRAGFDIEPAAGGRNKVTPPPDEQRQIVQLAQQHPDWRPADLARHLGNRYSPEIISIVLRRAGGRG